MKSNQFIHTRKLKGTSEAELIISDNRVILTFEEFSYLKHQIVDFIKIILRELRTEVRDIKDILFMYSLARAVVQIESIFQLYKLNHYSDCLILYRTQVERLLTLYYLIDTNTIQEFDDWSFIQNFEARNKAKSDVEQKNHLNKQFWQESPKRISRYKKLKEQGVNWERPTSNEFEEIAVKHNALWLYKYGYKHSSGYVHPLASDGAEEFGFVTGIQPRGKIELDYTPIISNATVVFILIVDFALNEMNFEWIGYVFKFIESIKEYIQNGSTKYWEYKNTIDNYIKENSPIFRKYKD